ncbi:MAG TPA: transposase [Candidatus Hydrogenedentes bacterium]|nr:transposase [Candidatus Hydrogenedentota bacterium]
MNLIHLIYSTKNRDACLTAAIRPKLFAYQAAILREWDSRAIVIGGISDHLHTLLVLSKNHALCKVVEEVKRSSSKWLKTQGRSFAGFHWQNGYGAFSVSQSHVAQVRRYIENQEEHHRTMSFQDEFRLFLRRYKLECDERYVWD